MEKHKFDLISKSKMMKLKTIIGTLKYAEIIDWIDNFLQNTDEKLIVFGIHKKLLKRLHKQYKKISVLVNGEVSAKDRNIRTKTFQRKKECRIFFGNIQAAGTGWNGTVSSTVLFVEIDWVPANMTQAADRPHRIGQKNNVSVYFLVAKDTIEEHVCRLVENKQNTVDQVLDGKKNTKNMNIMQLLLSKIMKDKK